MTLQYWHWLAIVTVPFIIVERVWPRDAAQRFFRPGLWSDLGFFVLNGHFVGAWLATATMPLHQRFMAWMSGSAVAESWLSTASSWPLWVQFPVAFVGLDFVQWCTHNLLHRVPWLWEFHKVHHSIQHMDFWGSLRFHWVEILVYRTTQYIPLIWLGFSPEALLGVAVISTLIGHFNHANLSWNIGWLGYVFNNPRMHLWHHAAETELSRPVNFGINLSVWDYLFGTAWVPDVPPSRLGFRGLERWRGGLLWLEAWPLSRIWLRRPAD